LFYFASTNLTYYEFIFKTTRFFISFYFLIAFAFAQAQDFAVTPTVAVTDGQGGFKALDGARGITTVVIGEKTYALVASSLDDGVQIMEMSNSSLSTGELFFTSLTLYPNPVTTTLQIQSPLATEVSYRVYDLTGKALSTHHITGQSHSIDVSTLAKGVYLLEATHNNSTTAMQFVKE
jgi:hypothetical protein